MLNIHNFYIVLIIMIEKFKEYGINEKTLMLGASIIIICSVMSGICQFTPIDHAPEDIQVEVLKDIAQSFPAWLSEQNLSWSLFFFGSIFCVFTYILSNKTRSNELGVGVLAAGLVGVLVVVTVFDQIRILLTPKDSFTNIKEHFGSTYYKKISQKGNTLSIQKTDGEDGKPDTYSLQASLMEYKEGTKESSTPETGAEGLQSITIDKVLNPTIMFDIKDESGTDIKANEVQVIVSKEKNLLEAIKKGWMSHSNRKLKGIQVGEVFQDNGHKGGYTYLSSTGNDNTDDDKKGLDLYSMEDGTYYIHYITGIVDSPSEIDGDLGEYFTIQKKDKNTAKFELKDDGRYVYNEKVTVVGEKDPRSDASFIDAMKSSTILVTKNNQIYFVEPVTLNIVSSQAINYGEISLTLSISLGLVIALSLYYFFTSQFGRRWLDYTDNPVGIGQNIVHYLYKVIIYPFRQLIPDLWKNSSWSSLFTFVTFASEIVMLKVAIDQIPNMKKNPYGITTDGKTDYKKGPIHTAYTVLIVALILRLGHVGLYMKQISDSYSSME